MKARRQHSSSPTPGNAGLFHHCERGSACHWRPAHACSRSIGLGLHQGTQRLPWARSPRPRTTTASYLSEGGRFSRHEALLELTGEGRSSSARWHFSCLRWPSLRQYHRHHSAGPERRAGNPSGASSRGIHGVSIRAASGCGPTRK